MYTSNSTGLAPIHPTITGGYNCTHSTCTCMYTSNSTGLAPIHPTITGAITVHTVHVCTHLVHVCTACMYVHIDYMYMSTQYVLHLLYVTKRP